MTMKAATGVAPAGRSSALGTIGGRLRAAREARGLGVRQLARELGCSAGHISQIERGMVEPSISLLIALAAHLRISMESLFADQLSDSLNSGDRPGSRSRYVRSPTDRPVVNLRSGVRAEQLLPIAEDGIDFCEYVYEPHASSVQDGELIRHPGREYGIVVAGKLSIQIGFTRFVLSPGESIVFDSCLPHRYWNDGDDEVRVIHFTVQE